MAVKDFEMRVKNTDGSYDILHPVTKMENVIGLEDKIILESGSNINGKYIKFGDGTLVCYKSDLRLTYTYGDLVGTWIFPHSFLTPPTMAALKVYVDGTYVEKRLPNITLMLGDTSRQKLALQRHKDNLFDKADTGSVHVIAIGRW